jgi:hypothetical protein
MSRAGAAGMYGRASTEGRPIVSVIVIEFITLDGIVSDPDGSGGTPAGGWAFRHGPGTVAGDKFQLGSVLDDGVSSPGRAWCPRSSRAQAASCWRQAAGARGRLGLPDP